MSDQPTTILLHGLGRDRDIMLPIEENLSHVGFDTYNLSYPSQQYSIAHLSKRIAHHLEQLFGRVSFNFVTHSLGSLILRYMSAHNMIEQPTSAVMLGPPNHGTTVINLLRRLSWFRKEFGPAALELATDSHLWMQLPSGITYPCGIIAGTRSIEPWFSWTVLKGPDDGKVTVESTKLNACDHITVPVAHRHLPADATVNQYILHYLQHQRFL